MKKIDLENIRSESFSIRTSKGRARVAKESLESKIVYQKICAKGSMKRGENWFPKNYEKTLTWKIFGPSHSRYVHLRGGLSSEIALQGGNLESKIVYRGLGADFEKP